MMRELRLDHHRPAHPDTGWRLLVAAMALSLFVAHGYVTASNRLETIASQRSGSGSSRADQERVRQELAEANRVIEELAMPWHALFEAIEQQKSASVALLSAHPEPKQQTILLNGEAKNYEAMLDFARQLESSGVLRGVHVQSHEIRQQDSQRPVFFILSARWAGQP